jgi:redox-sensitive bicupin YhaK (pirin superfamily)
MSWNPCPEPTIGDRASADAVGILIVPRAVDLGEMTVRRAGRGIVHSERTADERRRRGQRLSGIQTWMALPRSQEESDPAFMHHGAEALPLVEAGGIRARLIAGRAFGTESPLATASETLYADVQLEAGARMPDEAGHDERAICTIGGTIEIRGDKFEPGQLLVLRTSDLVTVTAISDARFMLFGGAPMEGPR